MGEMKIMINQEMMSKFSVMTQAAINKLDESQQVIFLEQFNSKKKSLGLAILCWLIGWHFLYFGRGAMMFLFWLTGGGLLIWWVIEAFKLSGRVNDWNDAKAQEILRNMAILNS